MGRDTCPGRKGEKCTIYSARKMETRLFLSFIIAELYYVYCRVSFTGRGTNPWKRGTTSTPSWEIWRHLEWRREDLFLGRSEHNSRNIELEVRYLSVLLHMLCNFWLLGLHILQEFNTLFLTRFRTYKIATPPQTKPRRGGGLRQINIFRTVSLHVNFFRYRHFALLSISLIFLR
jgi:hypothetical protein